MRRAVPFAILAGCLGVGVLPALAADQAVSINDYSFTPSRVAVLPGETVTWAGHGTFAMHNVHFDGEIAPLAAPSHELLRAAGSSPPRASSSTTATSTRT